MEKIKTMYEMIKEGLNALGYGVELKNDTLNTMKIVTPNGERATSFRRNRCSLFIHPDGGRYKELEIDSALVTFQNIAKIIECVDNYFKNRKETLSYYNSITITKF